MNCSIFKLNQTKYQIVKFENYPMSIQRGNQCGSLRGSFYKKPELYKNIYIIKNCWVVLLYLYYYVLLVIIDYNKCKMTKMCIYLLIMWLYCQFSTVDFFFHVYCTSVMYVVCTDINFIQSSAVLNYVHLRSQNFYITPTSFILFKYTYRNLYIIYYLLWH